MWQDGLHKPGVVLALFAFGMVIIPINDALIKLMSVYLSLGQIMFVRAIFSIIIVMIFSRGISKMFKLPAQVFWLFVGRGMCIVVAMISFFAALGSLPLAIAISIFFVSPLFITLLSVPILGETIGIHRAIAVLIGLVGMIVIIQPGGDEFRPEALLVVLSALSYAMCQIWTRRLSGMGDLATMVSVQQICFLVVGVLLVVMTIFMQRPDSGNPTIDFLLRSPQTVSFMDYLFILICGVSVLLLSVTSAHAYRVLEASVIAPFEYVAIPSGIFWGMLIWDDWPETSAWIGMALILIGGLYMVYREKARDVDVTLSAPMPASAASSQNFEPKEDADDVNK
ncbi:DMT family transporter [Alphaproteobacteria bacterium]|nr:DMT family transporter [Alphaproteobacteria bacterium]